ncbi:MAG: hypothetical protein JJU05_04310 [Verrucomicrobia bacterium]|nr:hypothetical protein [Verrucomicrobiota bacterium]MCH8525555.1 hypothetical protein [Kiritimatiellia bacterium]
MKKTSRSGSALLVTILVVSLLLVVTLAMVAVVRMELRTVSTHHDHLIARANAKLGAEIAIARLQELAGRDGRITATSALYNTALGQDRWTGVWDASTEDFLGWLVSGENMNPAVSAGDGPDAPPVWLVDRGNRNTYGVVVQSVSTGTGRYAFWVSDENTKAGLPPAGTKPMIEFPQRRGLAWGGWGSVADPAEEGRLRIAAQRGTLSPAMPLLDDLGMGTEVMDSAEGRERLQRMVSEAQIPLLGGNLTPGQDWFHDLTLYSRSLLVDVPRDSLRYDFTARQVPSGIGYPGNGRVQGGALFTAWSQKGGWLTAPVDGGAVFTRITPSEHLLTEVSIRFSVFALPPEGGETETPLVVRYQVQAETWNSSHMQFGFHTQSNALALRFRGLPPLRVSGVDGNGIPFSLPPINLEHLVSRVDGSEDVEVAHLIPFNPQSPFFGTLLYRSGEIRLAVSADGGNDLTTWNRERGGKLRRVFPVRDSELGAAGWIEHVFEDRMVPTTASSLNVALEGTDTMKVYVSTGQNLNPGSDLFFNNPDDLATVIQEFQPQPSFQGGDIDKPRDDESFVFGFGVELRKNLSELLQVQGIRKSEYPPEMFEPLGAADTYSPDPFENRAGIFQTTDGRDYFYRTSQGVSIFDGYVDFPVSVGGLRNIELVRDQRIGSPWPIDEADQGVPSDNWVFDRGFYSTLPERNADTPSPHVYYTEQLKGRRLANSYLELYEDENLPLAPEHARMQNISLGLGDPREAALHLWVQHGFNLNSLNVRAWESLFRAHRLSDWTFAEGQMDLDAVFFRFPGSAQNAEEVYYEQELRNLDEEGIRQMAFRQPFRGLLTEGGVNEPRLLAERLVARLRARSRPLFSVQEFVDEGILADLLDPDKPGAVSSINQVFADYKQAPIYLSQADIMEALAPLATVRGDTFVVRGYGQSGPSPDSRGARAYCEVIVQRIPTPMEVPAGLETLEDFRNIKRTQWHNLSAAGHPFGRRFKVIGFRWLSEDEI